MVVRSFTFNPFQTNCFVCHDGGEAAIIDASCDTPATCNAVMAYLDAHDLTVRHLLLTHGHIDHIFGCRFFVDTVGDTFQMHRADLGFVQHAREQATMFGVQVDDPPVPTRFLQGGDTIALGGATWQVLHTPGHSPGSVSFYDAANDFVIAGDVLFRGSIGRTDLPQGDLATLMRSIFDGLVPLGDDVTVYCGHGPSTTIGQERQTNPFLV